MYSDNCLKNTSWFDSTNYYEDLLLNWVYDNQSSTHHILIFNFFIQSYLFLLRTRVACFVVFSFFCPLFDSLAAAWLQEVVGFLQQSQSFLTWFRGENRRMIGEAARLAAVVVLSSISVVTESLLSFFGCSPSELSSTCLDFFNGERLTRRRLLGA